MADDLDAFLRQAAQRRVERQPAAPRPAPPPPAAPRQPAGPPPSRPGAPPPVVLPATVAPTPVAPETSRVGTRVNTSAFDQRAGQLGEEVGLADEHMVAHVAQTFERRAGARDRLELQELDAPLSDLSLDIDELISMLHDPQRVRYAVVLSEILRPVSLRPE